MEVDCSYRIFSSPRPSGIILWFLLQKHAKSGSVLEMDARFGLVRVHLLLPPFDLLGSDTNESRDDAQGFHRQQKVADQVHGPGPWRPVCCQYLHE